MEGAGTLLGKSDPEARSVDPKATRVALLTNMVGPGEVDDDLEDEVADECEKKYGEVVRVVIYEVEELGTKSASPTTTYKSSPCLSGG